MPNRTEDRRILFLFSNSVDGDVKVVKNSVGSCVTNSSTIQYEIILQLLNVSDVDIQTNLESPLQTRLIILYTYLYKGNIVSPFKVICWYRSYFVLRTACYLRFKVLFIYFILFYFKILSVGVMSLVNTSFIFLFGIYQYSLTDLIFFFPAIESPQISGAGYDLICKSG